jgi:hypothetical protein
MVSQISPRPGAPTRTVHSGTGTQPTAPPAVLTLTTASVKPRYGHAMFGFLLYAFQRRSESTEGVQRLLSKAGVILTTYSSASIGARLIARQPRR